MISASELGTRNARCGPLEASGDDEEQRVGRRGHRDRRDAEADQADAHDEDAPERIAHRAGDQDQGAQGDQVRVDDPLLGDQPAAQLLFDRGKGDVHDGAVEEGDERCERRDPDHKPLRTGHRRDLGL